MIENRRIRFWHFQFDKIKISIFLLYCRYVTFYINETVINSIDISIDLPDLIQLSGDMNFLISKFT